MAEIGLIASVISVAGAGIKLSITLYTFSETVATAADSIKAIAKDVSLTSAVLEELSSNLKHDEQARLYSGNALKTAQIVVVDCEAVFKQIDGALSKSMERIGGLAGAGNRKGKGGKVVLSAMEKLKWPFLQPKMQELRANLERLKSTLVLMLNVLTYARKVQTEKQTQPLKDDYQKLLIESLAAANQEATRNFQTLLRTIGPGDETHRIATASTRQLSTGESTLLDRKALSNQLQTRSVFTEEVNSKRPEAPVTSTGELPREIPVPHVDNSIAQFMISSTLSTTETTIACLKRIQQALNQFDASEGTLEAARHIKVSIELYKGILHTDAESRKREPWEVASIVRREDDGSKDEPDDARILETGYLNSAPDEVADHQKTAALQAQVDETVLVLRENINKVSQRGERLDSLQDETENLSVSAQRFRRSANRVRKQQGWLSSLSRTWNSLPSPQSAIASADEFLQEKFAAAFYKDAPEEDDGSTNLPAKSFSSGISEAASPKPEIISLPVEELEELGEYDDNELAGSSYKVPRSSFLEPHDIHDLPISCSDHLNNVVRGPDPAKLAKTEEKPALLSASIESASNEKQQTAGQSQDDTLAPDYLNPDIEQQLTPVELGEEELGEEEQAEEEQAEEELTEKELAEEEPTDLKIKNEGMSLREENTVLEVRTERSEGEDGTPSVESLLKEWTTLYD